MNSKSLITNLFALAILLFGYVLANQVLIMVGLFALSGALTNWLAIHMLFEKVPGLVGSGVIPSRFDEFKLAIKNLMLEQFFNQENIDRFLSDSVKDQRFDLEPVIQKVDLSGSYNRLVEVIMNSSFGGMLSMFGGADALTPLKEPFIENMKSSLVELVQQDSFHELLKDEVEQPDVIEEIQQKVAVIIDSRLDELTPQLVKEMVQQMIHQHLGWLVVWGGVFGGLIGFISAFLI